MDFCIGVFGKSKELAKIASNRAYDWKYKRIYEKERYALHERNDEVLENETKGA